MNDNDNESYLRITYSNYILCDGMGLKCVERAVRGLSLFKLAKSG